VFASHRQSAINAVWVGGRRLVTDGRHALSECAAIDFVNARRTLAGAST